MAKTHPHIDSPTRDQLASLVSDRPDAIREVYLALHEIVLDALPDVVFSVDEVDAAIGYGARQYGYGGWGMAAVTPFGRWASLTLMRGSELDDPAGLLEGTAGMRHVKLRRPEEAEERRREIVDLVRAASLLPSADG
ncbi:DUF1801 domain-containing protein [Microbacterium sp. gxy059]|uniref:DUF1801 domain-containing protein n=1 Tax=Microbacterium sp. gxy059 TaxID=2957199 RepID=UPI003D9888AD